jgi:hypothetical protein
MSSAINSHTQWNELLPMAQITKDIFYPEYDCPGRSATAPQPTATLQRRQIEPCKSNIYRYITYNPLMRTLKKHVKQQTHCLVKLGTTDL